jgi:hypothetical protein
MTVTTNPLAKIPTPAGAVRVHDWKRSPNDQATYRLIEGGVFPSLHGRESGEGLVELCVHIFGVDIVEDRGVRVVAREIMVGDRLRLNAFRAAKLGAALIAAADEAEAMAGPDQITVS